MTGRRLTPATRALLLVYAALGLAAGVPLYLGSEQTDEYFAWTIQPPLTAAFLGAAYWASCVVNLLASRESEWARVRVALAAGFVFTTLMLVATLLHLDRFHLDSGGGVARGVAWVWLIVYVTVPPLTLAFLVRQALVTGADEPRRTALPPWIRFALGCQAAVMIAIGAALVVAPQFSDGIWPWMLTPLTGRATGAWLVGVGVLAAYPAWENEVVRVRSALIAYAVLGVLEAVALARYSGTLDWGAPAAWLFVLFLLSVVAVGLGGSLSRRQRVGCANSVQAA
jgi:hypothetical protein